MDISNQNKLKLISGLPISVKGIGNIYPLTIKEIALIGEQKYNLIVGMLTSSLDDVTENASDLVEQGIIFFDFLVFTCTQDYRILTQVEHILSSLLRKKVNLSDNGVAFIIGAESENTSINRDNYDSFARVVRMQNCLDEKKPKKPARKNSKVEMLKQKRAKGRKLLQEARGENFCMADIISALGVFYGDLSRPLNMTIYQINDQYNKFVQKEQYEQQFDMYTAGADAKKLDLNTHWSANRVVKDMDNVAPPN